MDEDEDEEEDEGEEGFIANGRLFSPRSFLARTL